MRGSRALCHSSLSGQGRLSVSESIIATKASAVSLSAKADAHIGRGCFFIWEEERRLHLRELKSLLLGAFTMQGGQLEDFKGDNIWGVALG